ncbi:hypothetical protein PAEPH01_1282 [Pancytospora epiphaga]|nr:hypothetical protein PAEPH01_1282 [Pancytospora epiphaga]
MISSVGFIPNNERRTSLKKFKPDQEIKNKLEYLQIPLVDDCLKEDDVDSESDETIEADDSIIFSTPNTEEISTLSFHVYNKEEFFLHHDLIVFSAILDSTYIGNGLVALATCEPHVLIYDAFTRFPILPQQLLCGHTSMVTGIKQRDGRLLTCSEDGRIIEWDLEKMCPKEDLNELKVAVGSNCGNNNGIERFDFEGSNIAFGNETYLKINREILPMAAGIEKIRFNNEKAYILDASGAVTVYDPRDLSRPYQTQKLHSDSIFDISFYGKQIATGSMDGTVKIWEDGDYLAETHSFEKGYPIYSLAFDENGRLFCGSGQDSEALSEITIASLEE